MLKEMLQRYREKKNKFKEYQTEDRIQTLVEQRKKSSNERELEEYIEEDRQRKIDRAVKLYRMKKKAEARNMNMLKGKNIFKGHKSILTNNEKLFPMHGHKSGGKNIFNG
ncbi:hypothetical protein M0R04_14595 [Candidatus Dojkabacteria bacterium]|nr:hypothetical protein [Candidatus Dojkabacteria bacterium]